MIPRVWHLPLLLVLGLTSASCLDSCFEEDQSTQGPRVKQVRPKTTLKANTTAVNKQGSKQRKYAYSPVGKRDPFRSYLADLEEAGQVQRGATRAKSDLEKYTLDQLRLTGIITGIAVPIAMVEDPKGEGHKVKIGTRLGHNGGRITAILRDRVIITETFRDAAGRKRKVRQEISMPKENLIFQ